MLPCNNTEHVNIPEIIKVTARCQLNKTLGNDISN